MSYGSPEKTPLKYEHSKVKPLTTKQKRAKDRRTIEHQENVERIYGFFNPLFGGSLGVTYDGVNGLIIKKNRACTVA